VAVNSADEAAGGGPAFMPVANTTRRNGVITEIKRGIVLGTIKPGEKLTETQLSKALEVSRPTVREALNQAAHEGLLIQEPYRGIRVADLTPARVLDIADVRMALDLQAVSAILAETTGRRLRALLTAWDTYQRDALAEDPLIQHEAHIAFHRAIWEASENTLLMKMWPVTEAHLTIMLAHDQAALHGTERTLAAHRPLIEAVQSRDMAQIHAAFANHTVDVAKDLVAMMTRFAPSMAL
jgi:DNA-binding GntR family transcriptional regulator